MFSYSFALISVLILSIHGHSLRLRTVPSNNVKSTEFFGDLQNLIDQANQQTLLFSQSDLSDGRQDQLTFISCERIRPNIKNAFPADATKYFICRKDQTPEIFTCPNGGIFDDNQKACIDLCQQNDPCLNQGQCIILPDLKLECVCRRDWIGERCEIPLSSCAKNPCGTNNECRMLKTVDYGQDYVCICDKQQSYGKSCQRTVPNPCLNNAQQFHPFAFSRHAYINCDDELIFFQPCNSGLFWNQEDKRCDRSLPDILRKPFLNIKLQTKIKDNIVMKRPQFIQVPNQMQENNQEELAVIMFKPPMSVTVTEWQQNKMPINEGKQQQSNFMISSPSVTTQQWTSRTPVMRPPTGQRVIPQSNTFQMQTSRMPTKMTETTTMPMRTFQLEGFGKKNPVDQQTNENEPAVHSLLGWKTNPEESSNQMTTDKRTLNTPSTFQLRSWKS